MFRQCDANGCSFYNKFSRGTAITDKCSKKLAGLASNIPQYDLLIMNFNNTLKKAEIKLNSGINFIYSILYNTVYITVVKIQCMKK